MRTVVLPWDDYFAPLGTELGLRIVRPDHMTTSDQESAEFYVPEYSMRSEPIALMAKFPALAVVQALTAGVEHYLQDLPAGVVLCSGRGIHNTAVAEHAVALVLAALRGLPGFVIDGLDRRWERRSVPGLADRTVTILGAGGIGHAIAARLTPFECSLTLVGGTARPGVAGFMELAEILPRTEVLVACVPADESTISIIDGKALAILRAGALIVNVGRGSVVDAEALAQEVANGRLRAALDVVDPEPLPPEHPLWASGALITPHIGGKSNAFRPRAVALVEAQLRRWCTGERLINIVDTGISGKEQL